VTLDGNNVTVCSGGPVLPPPPVTTIPTLSGLAMVVLTGLLVLSALAAMRRRASSDR
jgi:hypothetical protein